jgi:rod shape-determining protein MreD
MKRLLGVALMLALALVQVTWTSHLEVYGAFPNLVLVAVVGLAWTAGVSEALVWACAGGLMLDLASAGPLGTHALALLVAAYATGFWVRNVDRGGWLQPALAAAFSTVLYSLILVGADDTLGLPVPPVNLAAQLTIAAAVYNALVMPPVLVMLRRAQPVHAEIGTQ